MDLDHLLVLSEEQIGEILSVDNLELLIQNVVKTRVDLVEILEDECVAVLNEEGQSSSQLEVVLC